MFLASQFYEGLAPTQLADTDPDVVERSLAAHHRPLAPRADSQMSRPRETGRRWRVEEENQTFAANAGLFIFICGWWEEKRNELSRKDEKRGAA